MMSGFVSLKTFLIIFTMHLLNFSSIFPMLRFKAMKMLPYLNGINKKLLSASRARSPKISFLGKRGKNCLNIKLENNVFWYYYWKKGIIWYSTSYYLLWQSANRFRWTISFLLWFILLLMKKIKSFISFPFCIPLWIPINGCWRICRKYRFLYTIAYLYCQFNNRKGVT